MKFRFVILLLALPLASCLEDPKLVKKREEQKIEIARLNREIQALDEKVKSMPEDVSSQLAEVKRQTAAQEDMLASLDQQVAYWKRKKPRFRANLRPTAPSIHSSNFLPCRFQIL